MATFAIWNLSNSYTFTWYIAYINYNNDMLTRDQYRGAIMVSSVILGSYEYT